MGYDLRTQRGYDFYLVSSSLQKAIRRGDVRCAGYFALELFPKYSEYCWKRLLTVSAEDCYGPITKEIMALYEGFKIVNKGKRGDQLGGRIFISKAVILLCTQPHSRDADVLSNFVYDRKEGSQTIRSTPTWKRQEMKTFRFLIMRMTYIHARGK